MTRSFVVYPFALALAAVGLCACGGDAAAPAADGGSVADGGQAGRDGGVVADGGGVDGGRADGGTDGGAGPQCNGVTVENLNTLGTVNATDHKLHYTGSNSATSTSLTVGLQVPVALQTSGTDPGLCAFKIGHQRIFSYTATAASVLRVSTTNPGTDVFMDTIVYIVDASGTAAAPAACARTPTATTWLGCNDDDPGFSGEQRRISSTAVTYKQVTQGQRVYISVGGFVSTTASATRDQTREMGNFELTVQELVALTDSTACDALRLANVCADTSWCVQSAPSSTTGTCRPRGSVVGAACDTSANPATCTGALTCDSNSGICVATVADGQPCDGFSSCGATSTCTGSGERGFISGVCRANGTAPLTACNASGACGTDLTCSNGVCLISATTTCSVWDSSCPQNATTPAMSQDCVSVSATGTAGTCTQTATTAGTSCTGTCGGALTCSTASNECLNTRNAGEACGPYDTCVAGSSCYLEDLNDRFHGRCVAEGTLGGPCATTGTACPSPAVCSNASDPANGRCVTQVADGVACNLTIRCSGANSSCVPDSTSRTGAFRGTCRAQGTVAGADCRPMASPACDSGLTCSTYLPESGICQTTATAGGACDPRYGSIRCPTGQVCRSTSLHLAGTCAAPTAEPNADSNDRPWSLGTAPAAITTPAAIQGSLAYLDADCYRVTVAPQGKLYAAVTSASGVCPAFFDLHLDVYRYDSTLQRVRLLGTDSGSGLSSCPRIEGGDASLNFPWAVNTGSAAVDWYVCLQNAATDRGPLNDYVLSLAVN